MSLYRCRDCGQKRSSDPSGICWVCAGERQLSAGQRAYLAAVKELGLTRFPHSDGNVLHAPGSCRHCSSREWDGLHELRWRFNIAYTDALLEADQAACPSLAWRPLEVIERWPGNQAAT